MGHWSRVRGATLSTRAEGSQGSRMPGWWVGIPRSPQRPLVSVGPQAGIKACGLNYLSLLHGLSVPGVHRGHAQGNQGNRRQQEEGVRLVNVAEQVQAGAGYLRVLVCPLDAVEDLPVLRVVAVHLRVLSP